MAVLVADTNKKLRDLLSIGLYAPDDAVWCLVPLSFYEGECPVEIYNDAQTVSEDGEEPEPVLVKDKFYGVEREEGVYIAVGRTASTPQGGPTGNYQKLSDAEFAAWVDRFGVDAFYVNVPEVEADEI